MVLFSFFQTKWGELFPSLEWHLPGQVGLVTFQTQNKTEQRNVSAAASDLAAPNCGVRPHAVQSVTLPANLVSLLLVALAAVWASSWFGQSCFLLLGHAQELLVRRYMDVPSLAPAGARRDRRPEPPTGGLGGVATRRVVL